MKKYEKIIEILQSNFSEEEKNFKIKGIAFARKKKWICNFNDDTCDWCKELHGKISDDDGKWRKQGYVIVPGDKNHKGCNCSWEWVPDTTAAGGGGEDD